MNKKRKQKWACLLAALFAFTCLLGDVIGVYPVNLREVRAANYDEYRIYYYTPFMTDMDNTGEGEKKLVYSDTSDVMIERDDEWFNDGSRRETYLNGKHLKAWKNRDGDEVIGVGRVDINKLKTIAQEPPTQGDPKIFNVYLMAVTDDTQSKGELTFSPDSGSKKLKPGETLSVKVTAAANNHPYEGQPPKASVTLDSGKDFDGSVEVGSWSLVTGQTYEATITIKAGENPGVATMAVTAKFGSGGSDYQDFEGNFKFTVTERTKGQLTFSGTKEVKATETLPVKVRASADSHPYEGQSPKATVTLGSGKTFDGSVEVGSWSLVEGQTYESTITVKAGENIGAATMAVTARFGCGGSDYQDFEGSFNFTIVEREVPSEETGKESQPDPAADVNAGQQITKSVTFIETAEVDKVTVNYGSADSIGSESTGDKGTQLKSDVLNEYSKAGAPAAAVKMVFLNISPFKGSLKKSSLTQPLHIKIPYENAAGRGMYSLRVARIHGGNTKIFEEDTSMSGKADTCCYKDDVMHFWSQDFSTFALTYSTVKTTMDGVTPSSGSSSSSSGSSSSTTYYGSGSSGSSSSSGGGGGGGGSSLITKGKGTSKACYSKTGKGKVRYEMCSAKLSATKAVIPDTIKIGKKTFKVTSISSQAFIGYDKMTTITINAKNLTMKGVKGSLKDSKIRTIRVPKGKVAAYKKIFTKKNAGKAVSVKKK